MGRVRREIRCAGVDSARNPFRVRTEIDRRQGSWRWPGDCSSSNVRIRTSCMRCLLRRLSASSRARYPSGNGSPWRARHGRWFRKQRPQTSPRHRETARRPRSRLQSARRWRCRARWPRLRWLCLIRGVQALDVAPFSFRENPRPASARPGRARLDGSGTLVSISLTVNITSPDRAKSNMGKIPLRYVPGLKLPMSRSSVKRPDQRLACPAL